MIRGATDLFGTRVFTIRLPAVLSAAVVAWVIVWLSRPRDLLPLILLSPVLTFAAVMVTPDTPMLMFWALYLAWLVKVHERLSEEPHPPSPFPVREGGASNPPLPETERGLGGGVPAHLWLLGGVILGCGVLGKYTMGLAAVAGGVSFLLAGNTRRWAAGYALHALVAMVVASPILIHNIRYDFVPIRYQWGHSMGSPAPGFGPFAEFVGVQVLLLGAIPFVVFAWALWHRRELLADPRLRVCLCLFALPLAFFLWKATRGRIEGNWAFPCYLACWPLAAEWYRRVRDSARWRWATRTGFALPLGASAFFLIHLVEPIPYFPAKADRATRQHSRMEVGHKLAADLRAAGYSGPVHVPTYQWTAILRWHGIDARQIEGMSRASHFTGRGTDCPPVLVFTEAPSRPAEFSRFGPPQSAACYPIIVRGVPHEPCWLLDYSEGTAIRHGGNTFLGAARLDPTPRPAPR
jgi:hypothetical protein